MPVMVVSNIMLEITLREVQSPLAPTVAVLHSKPVSLLVSLSAEYEAEATEVAKVEAMSPADNELSAVAVVVPVVV